MTHSITTAQICNLALAHINQTESQIANLDTDTGTTAIQCRIHYDLARQVLLSDHHWGFAKKRVALADLGNPPSTWDFRYDYPADCVRFHHIQLPNRDCLPIRYSVEDDGLEAGLSILTDDEGAIGVYTYNVENTVLFTPMFSSALSWYLASELAVAIAGDSKKQEQAFAVYGRLLSSAKAMDSEEGQQDPEFDSPWERARQGRGDEYA
jgi:hypothetical protein